jgi:hypothetical protein
MMPLERTGAFTLAWAASQKAYDSSALIWEKRIRAEAFPRGSF